MIILSRGQTLSVTNPKLTFVYADDGKLADISSLAFAIYSLRTIAPQEVVARTTVDVTTAAGRLGKGRYFAPWAIDATADVCQYEIRWYYKINPENAEQTFVQRFEMADGYTGPTLTYCSIKDMRDEGVTASIADDSRVAYAIGLANAYIERVTGRWFSPQFRSFTLDGTRSRFLPMPMPIIGIESVTVAYDGNFSAVDPWDPAAYRAYARHVSEGIWNGDDRQSPKIEIADSTVIDSLGYDGYVWPRGNRNIQVKGVFGYTDYDGSFTGHTPELIRRAAILLALRWIGKAVGSGGVGGDSRGPVKREKTRDQEVEYVTAANAPSDSFTGDPEVDGILESFKRPPMIAAV